MKISKYLISEQERFDRPIGKEYKKLAREIVPEHFKDLTKGISDDMSGNTISEIIFRKGEYLGGIADILIKLIVK